jgi:hypothetical protein
MKRGAWLLVIGLLGCGSVQAREEYEAKPGLLVPSGLITFVHSQGPLSYASLTRRELPPDAVNAGPVSAQSCQYALSVPLSLSLSATSVSGAAGNGGYDKALRNLSKTRPELRGLYDVIVDLHRTSVLGVFSRLCTEIHARAYQ